MRAKHAFGGVLGSVLFCAAVFATPASATYVPKMSTKELAENTALVFEGTVKRVDIGAGDASGPKTTVTFSVDDVVVGDYADSEITFRLPVGALPDGTFMMVAGLPLFNEGDSYLMFIRDGDWAITPVTNWQHSFFRRVNVGNVPYFANEVGRGVSGLGERGVELAKTIAAPNSASIRKSAQRGNSESALENRPGRGADNTGVDDPQSGQDSAIPAALFKAQIRSAWAQYRSTAGRIALEPRMNAALFSNVHRYNGPLTVKPAAASPARPGVIEDKFSVEEMPVEEQQ